MVWNRHHAVSIARQGSKQSWQFRISAFGDVPIFVNKIICIFVEKFWICAKKIAELGKVTFKSSLLDNVFHFRAYPSDLLETNLVYLIRGQVVVNVLTRCLYQLSPLGSAARLIVARTRYSDSKKFNNLARAGAISLR